jgi:hypothetical protein
MTLKVEPAPGARLGGKVAGIVVILPLSISGRSAGGTEGGAAGKSRHRRDANRAPPRRLSGNALSVHPRRANREYPRAFENGALSQRPDAAGGRGVSLTVGNGWLAGLPDMPGLSCPCSKSSQFTMLLLDR